MPKVISWDWFKPIVGELAPPIIFELRNTIDPNTGSHQDDDESEASQSTTMSPTMSPVGDNCSSLDEDEALERAIKNSLEDGPHCQKADSALGSSPEGSDDETTRGEDTPKASKSRARGVKRGLGDFTTTTPKKKRSSDKKPCGEKESSRNELQHAEQDVDDEEVLGNIKQEPQEP